MGRCECLTVKGKRCRRSTGEGSTYCSIHLKCATPASSLESIDDVKQQLWKDYQKTLHAIIKTYVKQIKGQHRISNVSLDLLTRFSIDAIFELVSKADSERKEDRKLTLTVDNLIYTYKEDLNDDYLLDYMHYRELVESLNIMLGTQAPESLRVAVFERIIRQLVGNSVRTAESSRIFVALYFKYLIIETLEKAAKHAKTTTINEEDIEKAIDN